MIFLPLIITGLIYLITLSNSIYGGDAGDLVSAILSRGFAHPPGYSLYTLIGIVFTQFPFSLSPAGKTTLISSLSTMASFIVLYKIMQLIFKSDFNKIIAITTIIALGFSYIIWLYAIVPEVFPLNTLLVLITFYSSLSFHKTRRNIYLYILALVSGLAFSHHHTFILVLPSVLYLLWIIRMKIKVRFLSFLFCLFLFIAGLLPNLQMFFATRNHAAVTWGNATDIKQAFAIVTRQNYGTFTAGSFITSLPRHRILQIKNLFLYIKDDFTYLGIFTSIIGLIFYFRLRNRLVKIPMNVVLINIFFFGPFFLFYANFPIGSTFFFATMERFLHVFYFFFAILIYYGIQWTISIIEKLIRRFIIHENLNRLAFIFVMFLFFIYPIGQYTRNFRVLSSLKHDYTAEKLGMDILRNAPEKSIIFLSGDTVLFDTEYVYYSSFPKYKSKIIVHTSKLTMDYYQQTLKTVYPTLRFNKKEPRSIESFIEANIDTYPVYSNDAYKLTRLKGFTWVPQGILFKLEKESKSSNGENLKKIEEFWSYSQNRYLHLRVKKDDPIFKNLFLTDILRIYGIAHQNSADFLIKNGKIKTALTHLNEASILQPDDPDISFLMSKYFAAKGECLKAEKEIVKVIKNDSDNLYINQLKSIGNNCFSNESDRARINRRIRQYELKKAIKLQSF